LTRHERETHGINIRELELACPDGPVQARVWDFGGQHVLHAMHEFFLTARSLYLLVLGERDDMAESVSASPAASRSTSGQGSHRAKERGCDNG
jgi:DAPkinase-like Roc (Ras of Complex) protein